MPSIEVIDAIKSRDLPTIMQIAKKRECDITYGGDFCLIAAKEGSLDALRWYIEKFGNMGPDHLGQKGYMARSVLTHAILNGQLDVVNYLVHDSHKYSPLIISEIFPQAVGTGHIEIVRTLMPLVAKVDPRYLAAIESAKHLDILKLLFFSQTDAQQRIRAVERALQWNKNEQTRCTNFLYYELKRSAPGKLKTILTPAQIESFEKEGDLEKRNQVRLYNELGQHIGVSSLIDITYEYIEYAGMTAKDYYLTQQEQKLLDDYLSKFTKATYLKATQHLSAHIPHNPLDDGLIPSDEDFLKLESWLKTATVEMDEQRTSKLQEQRINSLEQVVGLQEQRINALEEQVKELLAALSQKKSDDSENKPENKQNKFFKNP